MFPYFVCCWHAQDSAKPDESAHQLRSLSTSNTTQQTHRSKQTFKKDDRLQLTTAQTCTPENISVPPYPNATQWVAEPLASVSSHLHVDDPTRAITQHASAARLRVQATQIAHGGAPHGSAWLGLSIGATMRRRFIWGRCGRRDMQGGQRWGGQDTEGVPAALWIRAVCDWSARIANRGGKHFFTF
jgi:hypothetical protein